MMQSPTIKRVSKLANILNASAEFFLLLEMVVFTIPLMKSEQNKNIVITYLKLEFGINLIWL